MRVVVGGRVSFSQHNYCLQVLRSEGQEEAALYETQFFLLRPWYHVLRVEWRKGTHGSSQCQYSGKLLCQAVW